VNIGGLFAILDDVAATLDDVAVMSKIAAKKTAGILGDDLAVNANMSAHFASEREIPVLWAIAKGSFINKLIILPIAFLLSAFAPWLIAPILIVGALYLSYEGAEKIEHYVHTLLTPSTPSIAHPPIEDETEQQKIKQAITTDFILSIEIIVLALGTVSTAPLLTQIMVTSLIALLATVGVYGLVALLVRMDDFGFSMVQHAQIKQRSFQKKVGNLLITSLPKIIKALTVIGVIAMLLVAGGIFTHNVAFLHHYPLLNTMIAELFLGLIAGFVVIALFKLKKFFPTKTP
jgi:predicted DNA repair protein MutK